MFNVPMMTVPRSEQPCRSWIFVVVMLFSLMSVRRAVLGSFIGAVLFLPQAAITSAGLLYYVTHAYDAEHPDEHRRPWDSVEGFPWATRHG